MLPHYHSVPCVAQLSWSQWSWFGELEERLLGCCRQGLDTWKTAARFGYVKDCCKVWIRESGLLQGLDDVKDCCKVWIRERLLQGFSGYVVDCCFGRRGLKHTQCGATSHWVFFKPLSPKHVFQASKPCRQQPKGYLEDFSFAKLLNVII